MWGTYTLSMTFATSGADYCRNTGYPVTRVCKIASLNLDPEHLTLRHCRLILQRNGVDYCLTIFWPDNELKEPKDVPEGWDEKMPTANINLDGFDDR